MTEMKTAQAIAVGAAIGLLSGVGMSQVTFVGDVKEHSTKIAQLEKDRDADRIRTDARIYEVASLVKEVIQSNRELIHVLKMQSELLQRKENGKL